MSKKWNFYFLSGVSLLVFDVSSSFAQSRLTAIPQNYPSSDFEVNSSPPKVLTMKDVIANRNGFIKESNSDTRLTGFDINSSREDNSHSASQSHLDKMDLSAVALKPVADQSEVKTIQAQAVSSVVLTGHKKKPVSDFSLNEKSSTPSVFYKTSFSLPVVKKGSIKTDIAETSTEKLNAISYKDASSNEGISSVEKDISSFDTSSLKQSSLLKPVPKIASLDTTENSDLSLLDASVASQSSELPKVVVPKKIVDVHKIEETKIRKEMHLADLKKIEDARLDAEIQAKEAKLSLERRKFEEDKKAFERSRFEEMKKSVKLSPVVHKEDVAFHDNETTVSSRVLPTGEFVQSSYSGHRTWHISAGRTVHDILDQWCHEAGWQLDWKSNYYYRTVASADIPNATFIEAVQGLIGAYENASPPLSADIKPDNHSVRVFNAADADLN